jgi:hypothetical protein
MKNTKWPGAVNGNGRTLPASRPQGRSQSKVPHKFLTIRILLFPSIYAFISGYGVKAEGEMM